MRAGAVVGTVLLMAVSLTGCSSEDAPPDSSRQAKPLIELALPAAYDANKGWDETLSWVPQSAATLPVAVAPRAGAVALLHSASNGYTLKVRAADTGRVRWTSAPWKPPTPLEGAAGDPSEGEAAEIPGVAVVEQDGREYVVAYAHGLQGKDSLHKGTEVMRLLVYSVDATGTSVKPLRQIDVPVTARPGQVRLNTEGGRVLVGWGERGRYPTPSAAVDVATGETVAYDQTDDLKLPCPDEYSSCSDIRVMAATADGPLVSMDDGGFGIPGRWFSNDVRPDGTNAQTDSFGNNWNGMVYGVGGGHLIAGWDAPGFDTDPVWSVHDVRTGRLQASMTCGYDLSNGVTGKNRESEREYPVVVSPGGHYLAAGPVAFDLQRKKGICLAGDGNRKSIAITSIHDDGTAYGEVQEDSAANDTALVVTQVDLTAGPDSAKALEGVEAPHVTSVKGAGLFTGPDNNGHFRVSLRQER
ncbi:hypothetical protein [Streptomyces thermoalcalitolerans]|uniref:Uncharacterized protein n=1 Tax=Streptomyces thermoalcalitolerans TaxID=65605 RepID=A0ABP3Z5J8_9ACTN